MKLHKTKSQYHVTFSINLCDSNFKSYEVFATSESAALRKAEKIIQQDAEIKSYGLPSIHKII